MAMAMLITPSSHHPLQPSFCSDYHSSSGAGASNMISSVDPHKPGNGLNYSNRQPLPSISELIQDTKPSPSPRSPSNTQPGSNLSSSFAAVSRSFSKAEKHSSPQPLRSASSFSPQQDALTFFTGSRPPPLTSRPLLPPISDRQAGLSAKPNISPQQHHPKQQSSPRPHHPLSGVHAHRHPPPPPPARVAYKLGQQPPGQMRLPASPISPKHVVLPHASKPYHPWARPHKGKGVYARRARYDTTVNRHFKIWSYQEYLSQIGSCSHTVLNFSEAYSRIAQEQHGAHPIPDILPTERDISDMLANIEFIKLYLEQVRGLVQTSSQNERAREAAKIKDLNEAHDVPVYGDAMKPQYGMIEVKTRCSRTVSLDKCHRCNRTDTPEWRRGPDGARTLCNACGLRYAKLKKVQQLEARSSSVKLGEAHSH
ncbi:hypothetical protein B0J13DRAFT_149677 [Dactylonectria estremocensis]|uniref:GATA-type domain-containing protein n=1 Tax=Dactylonectria estremocensis TaxID=1079267 RepID=A0A9P9DT94_9HYPO|nr:hypothetical protein B0J13DRAFT_149677 [Dactylonectria estremocensis]